MNEAEDGQLLILGLENINPQNQVSGQNDLVKKAREGKLERNFKKKPGKVGLSGRLSSARSEHWLQIARPDEGCWSRADRTLLCRRRDLGFQEGVLSNCR